MDIMGGGGIGPSFANAGTYTSGQPTGDDPMTRATNLLRSHGVSEEGIRNLITDRNSAQGYIDSPELIIAAVTKYPAPESLYDQALTDAGEFPQPTPFVSQGIIQDPKTESPWNYSTSQTGYIRYGNGVLANPNSGDVFYPTDRMVPGSPAWLNKASGWSQEKINTWRKKLSAAGYKVEKKGGFDQSLYGALAAHFKMKYLNFGKAVPLSAGGAEEDTVTAKEALDPAGLRNEVRAAVRTVYGDEASDGELEYWTQFIRKQFNKRSRHGKTPTAAAGGAQEAFKESFMEDPQVQFYTQSQEDNTELRDSLLATVQTINSLA